MLLSTMLQYSDDPIAGAERAVEMERAGLDVVWVPEAYSFDAVSLMGYLAARTERVQIGSGILPIYTRTPSPESAMPGSARRYASASARWQTASMLWPSGSSTKAAK